MASNYGLPPTVWYDAANASYWENQSYTDDPDLIASDADLLQFDHVDVRFTRTEATGIREDIAQFGLNMIALAGAIPAVDYMTDAHKATVEGFIDTWWTTVKPRVYSHWLLNGYQWRRGNMGGPYSVKSGFVLLQPVNRVTSRSVAGTNAVGLLADQSSQNVTFQTASRKHWGRAYPPAPASDQVTANSRFTTAACDAVGGAWDVLLNAMGTNATVFAPVVASLQHRGLLTLVAVKVDDVPDVIRRRRPKLKTYEKRYANTA